MLFPHLFSPAYRIELSSSITYMPLATPLAQQQQELQQEEDLTSAPNTQQEVIFVSVQAVVDLLNDTNVTDFVIHGPHGKTVAAGGLFEYSLEKRRAAFAILHQLSSVLRKGETLTRCTVQFATGDTFIITSVNIQGHIYGLTTKPNPDDE